MSGYAVLSDNPLVRVEVVYAASSTGSACVVAGDVDELLATIEATGPSAVLVDIDHADASEALGRLSALASRDRMIVIGVYRDAVGRVATGAHALVSEPALRRVLVLAERWSSSRDRPQLALDRLLRLSVLAGPLDSALAHAADEIAAGFGVDRCLISVRGDSTGGGAVAARTWDSLTWTETADRCRAAAEAAGTLIAQAPRSRTSYESYLAVRLEAPGGSNGFVGLVAERPHLFSDDDRAALEAVASRIGAELGWRAVHERTSDDLDRSINGPGVDSLLAVWNRPAIVQLTAMAISAMQRAKQPLTVLVLDVEDLQGINTRYGHDVGDRVLRRIADAVRAMVRTEDAVGRWAGDKLAVALCGAAPDGAQRLAERVHATLAARPLEVPNGRPLAIATTFGLAAALPAEDARQLLARAALAAKKARDAGVAWVNASTGPQPRLSQQIELGEELRATLGGTYRLLHEISRGGMGVVYRAEDLALERPVAVKMLRPDLAEDRAFVEHLRGEAAMLARLQHPNLVQIYNFGQTEGDSYFVMELVEGEALQQAVERHRIEGTTLPVGDVVTMIEQVASALDALHERGIVHRDVKPGNVIRDPFRSRSVLVDVGIARRYGQFVESAGTPGYVAPEVIRGEEATPRSDVYGLAATAYTVLALASPWGDGSDVLARQCSGDPPQRPSMLRPELAAADTVLLETLSMNPADRPGSAGAFARALSAALSVSPARDPRSDRWVGNVVMPSQRSSKARTRGVVFRSFTRAVGVRDAERLRAAVGDEHADLSRSLTEIAPLAWLSTDMLVRLLAIAPAHVGRDAGRLARDIARAAVRISFRRFFPSSAATLVPDRTLSAIRSIWGQYQSWGVVSSMPVRANEMVIRMTDTPRVPELCMWASGMIEQLVILSGGREVNVDHEACEARGNADCLHRVTWKRAE